jgi:hypothetical protein
MYKLVFVAFNHRWAWCSNILLWFLKGKLTGGLQTSVRINPRIVKGNRR